MAGQFSMVIDGVQFEAESMAELQDKVNQAARDFVEQVRGSQPPPTVDRGDYFGTFYTDPMAAQDIWYESRFGKKPQQAKKENQEVSKVAAQAKADRILGEFANKHPELLQVSPEDDLKNGLAISKILQENGWDVEKLDAAYALARERGQIVLPVASAAAPGEAQAQGVSIPRTVSPEAEKQFYASNPPAEAIREYLEKVKHPEMARR